jgi:pimeloyl-ACP methyl ester carboxylesterase
VTAPREEVVAIRDGAVRFQYLVAGRGAPVVFFHSFHGLGGWPELLERLAERYTVLAPLHPGTDGSEGVDALDDVMDLALAYDEWLAAVGCDRARLVGHSFGGMVALEIGALCPSRVEKLALLSPLGLWLDGVPQADIVVLPAGELHPLLWKEPESAVARTWAPPASEEAQAAAQVERIQRLAAMGKFVWPIPDKGLKKRLHRVVAPTLLLWGDDDRVNPIAYGEEFLRRLRHAELRVLPGGHMLPYESPAAVTRAVADFLG